MPKICELSFFDSSSLLLPRLKRSKFRMPLNEKNTLTPNERIPTGTKTSPLRIARSRYPTKQIPVMLLPSTSLKTIMVTVRTNGSAQAMKWR